MRHVTRHFHATVFNRVVDGLTTAGWVNAPVNFGAEPVDIVDYQPDERGEEIKRNTVAVSLGDVPEPADMELGCADPGGLRSITYAVFIDVYMREQPYTTAICDDIRDLFFDQGFPLVNQITGLDEPDHWITTEVAIGPERPDASIALENFKRYWRIFRLMLRLDYPTS